MKTTDPKKRALLDSLKDGLIVSCQVQKDDPIYTDDIVVKMAEAAKWAGAVGIRANSPEQIKAIKDKVDLPMIGLWKIWHDDTDVFITPTMEAARAVWEAGAEIIALDCTAQITHEKTQAWDLIKTVKKEIPEAIIFADVSNMEEAARAVENGADIVASNTVWLYKGNRAYRGSRLPYVCGKCAEPLRMSLCYDGRTHLYTGGCDEVHLSGSTLRRCRQCYHTSASDRKTLCRPAWRLSG